MSEQLQGVLLTAAGLVAVTVLGIIGNYLVKRLRNRASEPEMWKRLDELSVEVYGGTDASGALKIGLKDRVDTAERRDRVKGYIIRSLVRQWPVEDVPRLDPGYLSELDEDTLPLNHPWRVKP